MNLKILKRKIADFDDNSSFRIFFIQQLQVHKTANSYKLTINEHTQKSELFQMQE